MEQVVAQKNMMAALKRVERNGGAPGVDGIPLERLQDQIRAEWSRIREELLAGTYSPMPVRPDQNLETRGKQTAIRDPARCCGLPDSDRGQLRVSARKKRP